MAENMDLTKSLFTKMLEFDTLGDFVEANHTFEVKNEEYWKILIDLSFSDRGLDGHFENVDVKEKEKYLEFAVSCLTRFVQSNFTGPDFDDETEKFLKSEMFENTDFRKLLIVNNEEVNVNTKFPCLLVAANAIFMNCLVHPVFNFWWQLRSFLVHQKIRDELSPSLLSSAEQSQKFAIEFAEPELPDKVRALFEIEQAQLYCVFSNVVKADKHIKAACDILNLKYELLGKLGKRTKYQEKDIAQLTLKVTSSDKCDEKQVEYKSLPQNVSLNDDVRLETIKFTEEDEGKSEITILEQKLLLAIIHSYIISRPQDSLYFEELMPFIDFILKQKNTWSIRTSALLLRCKLEEFAKRTTERSMMQCEELMNALTVSEPSVVERVCGIYSTGLIPIWRTGEQYADLMMNLGMVKSCLGVYIKLQNWKNVIVCYVALEMREQAAEIIKEQLKVKPTVELYCYLGDVTNDVSCYEKAWEFSKRRSHRAQRHWGVHYFLRKKYVECIPHFEKSVSINPLQAFVWFRLGFAALEAQNWQVAATAYRRYTTLEPDGFEAWNNLAQAYIKLGNERNAHHALQDALRCNFENWKVWENFLLVSADISNLNDVIRSYHKLLDLREKYLNVDVLKVLVYGVCQKNDDENTVSVLMKKTRELLGRVTAIYPAEGALWELYAMLAPIPLLKIQRLQRAYRAYSQGGTVKDLPNCKHILGLCKKLGEAVLDDALDPKDTIINSVRLNISSAITMIKKLDYAETKSLLQDVTYILAKIIGKTKNASS